jgi:hypothetical protein
MDTGAALGGAGLFFSIAGIIYSAINHKHIKSRCCGKEYEMAIDIGNTSRVTIEPANNEIVGNEKEPRHIGRKVAPVVN